MIEDPAQYLVSIGHPLECKCCGEELPEGTPYWKDLCAGCYKKSKTGEKKNIGELLHKYEGTKIKEGRELVGFKNNKRVWGG